MSLAKRTYTLPPDVLAAFERLVPGGNRSGVVAGLLRQWLEERAREQLRLEVIQGCRDMAAEYLEIEQQFHPLEEEVQRVVDPPETRRRGKSAARSGPGLRAGR